MSDYLLINEDKPADRAGVFAEFFLEPTIVPRDSEIAKRPVYRDVEMVRIRTVGDNNSEICHKASDKHRVRFPAEYARFRKTVDDVADGTSLKVIPWLTPAKIREFEEAGFRTIEALAAATTLGETGESYVKRAQEWIDGDGGAKREIASLKGEVLDLKNEISRLEAELFEAAKPKPRAKKAAA